MKKAIRKILSVILCAVMLFTTASTAFAAEDSEEVLEKNYACHGYSNGLIVVTFSSKYSQTGEIPEVYLNDGLNTVSVADDEIELRIFEQGGMRYPQLFIKIENNSDAIIGIEIGAGAFVTESGETSAKVVIPKNKINELSAFAVMCEFEAIKLEEHTGLVSSKSCYYATVGKPVTIVGHSDHGKMWLNEMTATYSVNGKSYEIKSNEFVPQEPGRYVVELKLCDSDVVTKTFEIEVWSEKEAYLKNLGNATGWLFLSPLYAVFGTVLLLIPGFGMVMGAFTWYSVSYMVARFFTALFDGPVYMHRTLA